MQMGSGYLPGSEGGTGTQDDDVPQSVERDDRFGLRLFLKTIKKSKEPIEGAREYSLADLYRL
jgi:hypothetical protein